MSVAGSISPAEAAPAPVARTDWRISDAPIDYPDALAAMAERVVAIRAGAAPELVWLLEHPPLYTAGTSARPEDLTDPARFPTHATGRGGQWTYHGPGQRIAYVLLDLAQPHGTLRPRDIRGYVRALEDWLILTLDEFGLRGERREGRIGIWIADRAAGTEAKIAAVGVRVTRWVTWHGIALNVDPALDHFSGIVPCGVRGHGVTSLAAQGITATMADVDLALRRSWADVFGA